MKTDWQTHFRLPEHPNDTPQSTIASGASPDAQFIFDAIYAAEQRVFVFSALHINDELGFIENEKRVYCATLAELQAAIADFMRSPQDYFND